MRFVSRRFNRLQTVVALFAAVTMAACADQGAGSLGSGESGDSQSAPASKADYLTQLDYFQALQGAALRADYAAFAGHLKAANPATIIAELQKSFAGRPFDAYTSKTKNSAKAHQRVVELRGTGGRLYLYLELDKVAGGWNVGEHELDRSRRKIITRL